MYHMENNLIWIVPDVKFYAISPVATGRENLTSSVILFVVIKG